MIASQNVQPIDINGILSGRGILDSWSRHGIQSQGNRGWQYPIFGLDGQVIGHRSKLLKGKQKYLWSPSKPKHELADWYILPNTATAIEAADGICYLANGEPALHAYHTATITNSIATTLSEISVPHNAVDILRQLGVSRFIVIVDNDFAGYQSAIAWRDALRGSGIDFEAVTWGYEQVDKVAVDKSGNEIPYIACDDIEAKADANDLWITLDFDKHAFQTRLNNLPMLTLPELEEKEIDFDDSEFAETPDGLIQAILAAATARGFKGHGDWINGKSIFRDEKKTSFGINKKTGVGNDFTGKTYGHREVAERLGIDWKAYYPKKRRNKRKKQRSVADLNAVPDDTNEIFTPVYTPPVIDIDKTIHVQYVNLATNDIPKQGVTVIVSDKGTGKSTYGADVVKHFQQQGKSVMAITPFQTLTAAAANNYGLESYQSLKWRDWLRTSNLAITLKSIGNFALMDTIPSFDLLLLDEFSKMIEQLWSQKLYKKDEAYRVFNLLIILIQQAEHVIIMDADTKQEEVDFLKSIRGDVTVIVNDYSRDCGLLKVQETRDSLQDACMEALNNPARDKRSVFYVGNTASEIETMEVYLNDNTNYRVLSIHSGNSSNNAQRAFLAAPDDMITEYDAILLSPSAMTGIDIQTSVYAKFGCYVYSPLHTPAAEGCCQLFERARNADISHVWIQIANGKAETNPDVIYEYHRDRAIRTEAQLMGLDNGRLDLLPDVKRLHMMQSKLKARDNASRNNLFDNVLNLLSRNYTIEAAGNATSVHKEAIIEAAIQRKEHFDGLVLTVDPVNYEALEDKAKQGNVTLEDRAGHERFQIETFYNLRITQGLYEFDSNGRRRGKIRFYADVMLTPEKELHDFDWQEIEDKVPVLNRQHRSEKAKLAKAFIRDVWGSWQAYQNNEPILKTVIVERASQFLEKHFDYLKVYFDYRDDYKLDTWNTVKRFARRLGLPFKAVRTRDKDAPKQYMLDDTQREKVHSLAKSYRQGIETRRASENQPSRTGSVTKKRNSNKNISRFSVTGYFVEYAPDTYAQWKASTQDIPI